MHGLKRRKIRFNYPVELSSPALAREFHFNVTRDKLTCFGNNDYRNPTIRDTVLCMLPFTIAGVSCNSIWGSRSVLIDVQGSAEILRVVQLPPESSFGEYTPVSATRWMEVTSLSSTADEPRRELKQTSAEPIYLCARANHWDEDIARLSVEFRPAFNRESDKIYCSQKTLMHVAIVFSMSSLWLVPYVAALMIAVLAYLYGMKIFFTLLGCSVLVVCLTPLMLTKNNRDRAKLYIRYFFTRIQAEETKQIIRQRLQLFQALFFSSILICAGCTVAYALHGYLGIAREWRNFIIRVTLCLGVSWLAFFLCRAYERFFRDWAWIGLSVALGKLLDPHLNPLCRDKMVVIIMILSQLLKWSLPRLFHALELRKLLRVAMPKMQLVVSFFGYRYSHRADRLIAKHALSPTASVENLSMPNKIGSSVSFPKLQEGEINLVPIGSATTEFEIQFEPAPSLINIIVNSFFSLFSGSTKVIVNEDASHLLPSQYSMEDADIAGNQTTVPASVQNGANDDGDKDEIGLRLSASEDNNDFAVPYSNEDESEYSDSDLADETTSLSSFFSFQLPPFQVSRRFFGVSLSTSTTENHANTPLWKTLADNNSVLTVGEEESKRWITDDTLPDYIKNRYALRDYYGLDAVNLRSGKVLVMNDVGEDSNENKSRNENLSQIGFLSNKVYIVGPLSVGRHIYWFPFSAQRESVVYDLNSIMGSINHAKWKLHEPIDNVLIVKLHVGFTSRTCFHEFKSWLDNNAVDGISVLQQIASCSFKKDEVSIEKYYQNNTIILKILVRRSPGSVHTKQSGMAYQRMMGNALTQLALAITEQFPTASILQENEEGNALHLHSQFVSETRLFMLENDLVDRVGFSSLEQLQTVVSASSTTALKAYLIGILNGLLDVIDTEIEEEIAQLAACSIQIEVSRLERTEEGGVEGDNFHQDEIRNSHMKNLVVFTVSMPLVMSPEKVQRKLIERKRLTGDRCIYFDMLANSFAIQSDQSEKISNNPRKVLMVVQAVHCFLAVALLLHLTGLGVNKQTEEIFD